MRPETPPPRGDNLAGLLFAQFACRCLAVPHEFAVRRFGSMGERYAGRVEAALGLLLVPWLWVALLKPTGGGFWIAAHFLALIALALAHRIARWRRREYVHGWHLGDSRWGGRRGETLMGFAIGLAWLPLSPTVAVTHLVGTVCSRVTLAAIEARDRRIVDAMRDARIDAAYYAERLRNER